jgi:hypothetical protein
MQPVRVRRFTHRPTVRVGKRLSTVLLVLGMTLITAATSHAGPISDSSISVIVADRAVPPTNLSGNYGDFTITSGRVVYEDTNNLDRLVLTDLVIVANRRFTGTRAITFSRLFSPGPTENYRLVTTADGSYQGTGGANENLFTFQTQLNDGTPLGVMDQFSSSRGFSLINTRHVGLVTGSRKLTGQLFFRLSQANNMLIAPTSFAATGQGSETVCFVSGLFPGPPKQQEVTVQNTGRGLREIRNIQVVNGTVSVAPFTPGTTDAVKVTATKANQTQVTVWSFDAVDMGGNVTHCS